MPTITADITAADPALRGLESREPGSPCARRCVPDCTFSCHERHYANPEHDQFYCDQIRIGRDVTRYRPDTQAGGRLAS